MGFDSVAISGVAANDICATEAEDRARRLAPEYARLAEVAKGHTVGAKYDRERPFAETAKLIRRELAAAAKDPGSPLHGVRCRVRSGWSTHSRSLDVDIAEVPIGDKMPIMNARRVEADVFEPHRHSGIPWMSARGKRIEAAVQAIVDQYGYDRSDRATDYHDVAFYASISFATEVTAAHRAEVERAVHLARG